MHILQILIFLSLLTSCDFRGYSESKEKSRVGIKQIQFFDESRENRPIVFELLYPAHVTKETAFEVPFYTGFEVYKNAKPNLGKLKRPLILISPGRGGDRLNHLWLAAFLVEHGYIVATIDHYMAAGYLTSLEYVGPKIWNRPLDISRAIDYLEKDSEWSPHIDFEKIGVAGFSQGGFTALWVGGAQVNPKKFEAYQQIIKNNPVLPDYLKEKIEINAFPALNVRDPRIKAVFAMAPGLIQVFGFDEAGLQQLKVPTFLIAGEEDRPVPPNENAAFAAQHIPNATFYLLKGHVGHEIFMNECTEDGKNEFPGSCIDAPGVDRAELHKIIEEKALHFFNKELK